jgi:hypothetical protein
LNVSSEVPVQDFHMILSKILEEGFEWDLTYHGEEYKAIEFIPYVHSIWPEESAGHCEA